ADATWDPNADGEVRSLTLDGAGNIYAGGAFSTIGGQSRSAIAKLSATGTGAADSSWNPNAVDTVYGGHPFVRALALDGSGGIYISGIFDSVGGQTRNHIAKLSTSGIGAADAIWNPDPIPSNTCCINAFAFDGAGNVYVGGYFNGIGGQSRNHIAKLSTSSTGAADVAWNPNP